MKKSIKISIIFLIIFFLNPCFSEDAESNTMGIQWHSYSKSVFSIAKQKHKLILLYGKATWCHWCQKMNETYQDPNVAQLITANFIPVLVDIDNNKNIAKQYQITDLPTFIILGADGKVIDNFSGFFPPQEMIDKLQPIIQRQNNQSQQSIKPIKQPLNIVVVGKKKMF